MTAHISISATLNNSANNFVVSWQLASGGGIISSIAPTKPYSNPFQVDIPGLTPGLTYIITLWESATTSPTGTIRNATNVVPSSTTTTLRADDYLTADITPGLASGTTGYSNTSYAGWSYDVERVGQGTMYLQGAPNVTDPDYAQDLAGGFHLVRTGDVFGSGEKFVVRFQPQVSTASVSTPNLFSGQETISIDTPLSSSDLNKAIFIKGSGSHVTITLPPLSSVSDFQYLYFFSAGGSHVSAIFIAPGSDVVQLNTPTNQLVLCQNEQMKIFKANGVWNIDYISPSAFLVGEILYRYNVSISNQYGLNTVPADGSLLNRNTYYRLFLYLSNSGIAPVSETTWKATSSLDGVTIGLNKGNWTLGTDGTNFRVPDLRAWFLRGTDTLRGVGTGQWDAMLAHKHPETVGLLPGAPNGQIAPPPGPNMGRYGNPGNLNVDLTGAPCSDPGAGNTATLLSRTDFESRPRNIAIPILIRI